MSAPESPDLAAAWNLAILLCGQADKPTEESLLKTARAGHVNAKSIVMMQFSLYGECESCGALEECPDAKPEHFARRDALLRLMDLLDIRGKCESCGSNDACYQADPFASEIEGDDSPKWLCMSCANESARDV